MTAYRADKLRADESPHEDIAQTMLAGAGVPLDPPRPPVPAASPFEWSSSWTTSTAYATNTATGNFVPWQVRGVL